MNLRARYRWYQFGNRLQVFFLGLLLGVVLSGGFFLLKLDDYVKDFAMNNSLLNQSKDDEPVENATTDEPKKTKPKKTKPKDEAATYAVTDSTDQVISDDTSTVHVVDDGGDDIVVKKNELLGEKQVTLINLDGTKAIDSIRSKEAGIKEDAGKFLMVEFWQSPLNSKGYTMSRNRLILFGFSVDEQVSLYKLDNTMFMRTSGGAFRLESTADFRQLERVTDEALLAKLQ